MKARAVTLVTAGHLTTCPRLVKAADALQQSGYTVRVISARHTPWAVALDRQLHAGRGWAWDVVPYDRASIWPWLKTGVRFRAAQSAAGWFNGSCPYWITSRAFTRALPELVRAVVRQPNELIYGFGGGAIAAAAAAGDRAGVPYALDLEDFHCEEHDATREGQKRDALAAQIIRSATRRAAFVTAGSAAIAGAYAARFGIAPTPINNTFNLPKPPEPASHSSPLRLYWFSQTIGPMRGLEDVVRAAGVARIDGELHLRGVPVNGYVEGLAAFAGEAAPRLRVVHHQPEPADAMVDACRPFDVGLSVEQFQPANRALTLSNKALTYPLAGLAMVLTDTPGQRPLADSLGEHAALHAPGDVHRLAASLVRWSEDRAALRAAQGAAWDAARTRWHWEHASERGALLDCVSRACA